LIMLNERHAALLDEPGIGDVDAARWACFVT
jgi:hypothetical protein